MEGSGGGAYLQCGVSVVDGLYDTYGVCIFVRVQRWVGGCTQMPVDNLFTFRVKKLQCMYISQCGTLLHLSYVVYHTLPNPRSFPKGTDEHAQLALGKVR